MLIIFVIVGSSVGKMSIKNPAGIGSKAHDFLGLLLIILDTSSSVAGLKVSKEISEDLITYIQDGRGRYLGLLKMSNVAGLPTFLPNFNFGLKGTFLHFFYRNDHWRVIIFEPSSKVKVI